MITSCETIVNRANGALLEYDGRKLKRNHCPGRCTRTTPAEAPPRHRRERHAASQGRSAVAERLGNDGAARSCFVRSDARLSWRLRRERGIADGRQVYA